MKTKAGGNEGDTSDLATYSCAAACPIIFRNNQLSARMSKQKTNGRIPQVTPDIADWLQPGPRGHRFPVPVNAAPASGPVPAVPTKAVDSVYIGRHLQHDGEYNSCDNSSF